VGQVLVARPGVAAVDARRRRPQGVLGRRRQREERVDGRAQAIDDRLRHTVADDVEEADLARGPVDLRGNCCPLHRRPGPEG